MESYQVQSGFFDPSEFELQAKQQEAEKLKREIFSKFGASEITDKTNYIYLNNNQNGKH